MSVIVILRRIPDHFTYVIILESEVIRRVVYRIECDISVCIISLFLDHIVICIEELEGELTLFKLFFL